MSIFVIYIVIFLTVCYNFKVDTQKNQGEKNGRRKCKKIFKQHEQDYKK